jgi:hypothetical protein
MKIRRWAFSKKMAAAVITLVVMASLVLASPVFAGQKDKDSRPGWGYGDPNHDHGGPPGQDKDKNKDKDRGDQGSHGASRDYGDDRGGSGNRK